MHLDFILCYEILDVRRHIDPTRLPLLFLSSHGTFQMLCLDRGHVTFLNLLSTSGVS